MPAKSATKVDATSIAKQRIAVLGEVEVLQIARECRWLRRLRGITPVALVVACLSTLGASKATWIADILRTYSGTCPHLLGSCAVPASFSARTRDVHIPRVTDAEVGTIRGPRSAGPDPRAPIPSRARCRDHSRICAGARSADSLEVLPMRAR